MIGIGAGELDRRIALLRAASSDDGFSADRGVPAEVGKRWAKKNDVSDAERVAAAAQQQTVTTRFLVRFDSLTRTIGSDWLIDCEGVRYEVVGIKEARGTRVGIEITASAIIA